MSSTPFLNCPSCGKPINETDQLCPHCGLDLDAPLELSELQALAQPYLDKAVEMLESGINLKGALAQSDAALEYLPQSAEAHNLRGLILDGLGWEADAILEYREALRLDPNFVDARENLDDAESEHPNLDGFVQENEGKRPLSGGIKNLLIFVAVVIFLCVSIGAATLAFSVGRQFFAPKKEVIFEPDRSLVKTVSPADLQKTAEILQQRWDAFGYGRATFTVSDNGNIIGQIPADATDAQINNVKVFGLVEFVAVGKDRPYAGQLINTDFPSPYFKSGAGSKWKTIMTNNEISIAVVESDAIGNAQIAFTLTEKGSKIFADFTSKHIGDVLAITLDKKVISAPTINGAITSGSGVITGQFTKDEIENLAALIKTAPLPIPLK